MTEDLSSTQLSFTGRSTLLLPLCVSMDVFSTVVTCWDLVHGCVAIINKVQGWPDELRKITRRIGRLEVLLCGLKSHLEKMPKHGLDRLQQEQKSELESIIMDTEKDCKATHDLLDGWESRKIGATGIEFREWWLGDFFRNAYQKYGGRATDLRRLAEDLEEDRRDLKEYMGLLGIRQDQANHDALVDKNDVLLGKIDGMESQLLSVRHGTKKQKKLVKNYGTLMKKMNGLEAKLAALTVHLAMATAGDAQKGGLTGYANDDGQQSVSVPARQLTPEVTLLRKDYKIIFVDPHNHGRSVVSEMLVKLLGAWTESANGDWRVKKVQSAGFFERQHGDCAELIDGLDFKHDSYKLEMAKGGSRASSTAVAALFDNANYNFIPGGFKEKLHQQARKAKSKGIRRKMFKEYDYIIVFTRREHNNMVKLRKALVLADGVDALVKGKGRVMHLGQYLSSNGDTKEIANAPKNDQGEPSRENWDKKVLDLKIAIKRFLNAELSWKQPRVLKK